MVRNGDVCWLSFRSPDKRRPVVILTRDAVIDMLSDLSVAPTTRRIRDIGSQVVLDEMDGMPERCAINLDRIQTVDRTRLGDTITRIGPSRRAEIRQALLYAYGLDDV